MFDSVHSTDLFVIVTGSISFLVHKNWSNELKLLVISSSNKTVWWHTNIYIYILSPGVVRQFRAKVLNHQWSNFIEQFLLHAALF